MLINWQEIVFNLTQLAIAYVLALPIAWNREQTARSAGLRTFPLVAMASCGFMLQGISVLDSTDAEVRVMYGIITGVGFIGGGAILKDRQGVSGTATAASIWTTGAIGTAVAWQLYEIGIVLAVMNYVTLWLGGRVKKRAPTDEEETPL